MSHSASSTALTKFTLAQLEFFTSFPVLLNSSLNSREIVHRAVTSLPSILSVEAVTVFKLQPDAAELVFWEVEGEAEAKLEGRRIPADRGIVGRVVMQQQPALVHDVSKDPRFFKAVDQESTFITRDLICAPLVTGAQRKLGAIQAINSTHPGGFIQSDLDFLCSIANLVTVALENALIYEELNAAKNTLEVLDRRKDEMLQIICHEIRTPLAIIQNSAEIIAGDMIKNSEGRKRVSTALTRGIGRLELLAAKIRDLSSLAQGRFLPQVEMIELGDFSEEIKRSVADAFAQRKITFECVLNSNTLQCKADPTLLLFVLRELIFNAVRATPDGGKIKVEINDSLGMVEFRVSDTGIGIEASQFNLIFEKFYSVGSAEHHSSGTFGFRTGGMGLGLAMVKAILEAHASSIVVQSQPGQGASFSFSLPKQ